MRFDILTLFPEAIAPYTTTSILGRAQTAGHLTINLLNIRDFATDKHRTTDDTPYGGGAGMVMKIEPIDRALQTIRGLQPTPNNLLPRVVVLSARGRQFTQAVAQEYAQLDHLVLICGRYEGIDQRVVDHLADEELSIGPYVLAGGELPAMIVTEAVARLLPGVLGNTASLAEESHWTLDIGHWKFFPEYPQYTKPEEYNGWKVPKVLLSGNHAEIRQWREEQRNQLTGDI